MVQDGTLGNVRLSFKAPFRLSPLLARPMDNQTVNQVIWIEAEYWPAQAGKPISSSFSWPPVARPILGGPTHWPHAHQIASQGFSLKIHFYLEINFDLPMTCGRGHLCCTNNASRVHFLEINQWLCFQNICLPRYCVQLVLTLINHHFIRPKTDISSMLLDQWIVVMALRR